MLDISKIRAEFPILSQTVKNKPLIYFDNAATSQKPRSVLNALNGYYEKLNSNVHRGAHTLAAAATEAFEQTRELARLFINAANLEEIIYTKGTTEGINLVASSYARTMLKAQDEVLVSGMEHHSNIVPWQMACQATGAVLRVIPVLANGTLDQEAYAKLLTKRTRLVAFTHVSNALGTINPVKDMVKMAHEVGAVVLVDGAQAAPHFKIDVQDIDADFYVFSAHKVYGPTGFGILYGKKALLEAMPPYMGGGEMIKEVSFEHTTYNVLPYKFEAGTPNIADAVAFAEAIEFVNMHGQTAIAAHEKALHDHALELLMPIKGFKPIGTAPQKAGVLSFVVDKVHHFDVGMLLDAQGVAVRTGHHCTQPLMRHFGLEGIVRASFAVYNTKEEVEIFVESLKKVLKMLQ
ncbi:MAG: cysteine desulfurase [Cytophagales bacterium]|nr:MAG: cysteine desulfurase [Cytophagales bacterium]TAF61472.1 MAG: cysteine desulfurase [Cytophagales bacterium]